MKLRDGHPLWGYAVLLLIFSAFVSLHCGPGNAGGSSGKCGTGEARISGTTPFCQEASNISFQAFTPTCGTIERQNAVSCGPGGACTFDYVFQDLDTAPLNSTQFTGQWSCDGRELTFTPNNVEIQTGPPIEVTAHFN